MKHYGARDVVKLENIRLVESYLYDTVQIIQNSTMSSIYDVHNIKTIYTALMFMWSTLHRGTSNPLPFFTNFNEHYEYVMISDKDYEDEFNSRCVYLPKICQAQLKIYISNTHNFIDLLKYDNSILYSDLEEWGNIKILSRSRKKRRSINSNYTFFIVKGESEIQLIRPHMILSEIVNVWPFDLHNIRKSIGSLLSHRGCPDMVINRIMGHYNVGAEPAGINASTSPRAFKRNASPYLDEIAHDIGWRNI